jgi:hypothetical protein
MERTKYWNNTKPSETQLDNTENSKINQLQYRMRNGFHFGVKNGLRVTVSTDTTKIDISVGEGYTGGYFTTNNYCGSPYSGEHIKVTSAEIGLSLATYLAGQLNYVTLKYAEVASTPLPERFVPFTPRNTLYTETYTVSILTTAQWNGLSADEREQRILVGIVTAQGVGVPLTTSNIQQVQQPKTHPTSTAPSAITGVTLATIAQTTPPGTGTLRYAVGLPHQLFWTAPGDVEGAGVTILSSGVYTLFSNNTEYYILIIVVFAALPAGNTTENLNITALYGRSIPLFSAMDQAHRDMTGSGLVTSTNPHGLTLTDIDVDNTGHADLFHVNGIGIEANSSQLLPYISGTNIKVTNLGGYENSFLVDGTTYTVVTGYGAGTSADVPFVAVPALESGDYLIYIDDLGSAQRVKIAHPAAGSDPLAPLTNIEIRDMQNGTAGTCTLAWNATNKTLIYTAQGDGPGATVYIGNESISDDNPYGYYKIYSSTTSNWIIVYIDGALGATNTASFTTDMNSSNHRQEMILKIGVANWNLAALTDIHDIRQFLTADNRDTYLEEHDTYGLHTKPLKNTLRVYRSSLGIYASVSGSYGIAGSAAYYGIYGEAAVATGVYGTALNVGVYGIAATNWGVVGMAVASTGVYGEAANVGVLGTAASNWGVIGIAGIDTGVCGFANKSGVYGFATASFGVYGSASAYGVYGKASNVGVYGSASVDTGVIGYAAGLYGVFGTAATYGVFGQAAASFGVYGIAPVTGVYGYADSRAIVGEAIVEQGVYGTAPTEGVYGLANETAVKGSATVSLGVFGQAVETGVFGDAYTRGVIGKALDYTGVYGIASVTGVYGSASDQGGVFEAPANKIALNVINGYIQYGTTVSNTAPASRGCIPIIIFGGATYWICVSS